MRANGLSHLLLDHSHERHISFSYEFFLFVLLTLWDAGGVGYKCHKSRPEFTAFSPSIDVVQRKLLKIVLYGCYGIV